MIIYKIREDGRAGNFKYQIDSRPIEKGWLSISGDKIPEDISQYHEQKYIDGKAILSKNAEARDFLKVTDWKVTRHRDQTANGNSKSLTETKYKALLTERQKARDSVVEE